jgi:hypothetical protein
VLSQEASCVAAGGEFHDGTCAPSPCSPDPGGDACCYCDGTCVQLPLSNCAASGGAYYGGACVPNPCSPPVPVGLPPAGDSDRQGGDTIGQAMPISSLPFADSGSTAGYMNDYDEACPYTGSTAPDVVYVYTASSSMTFDIDLCASAHDTKVYVYQDGPGVVMACNDDAECGYSGYQSRCRVCTTAGHTYYIVVDGYGSSSGSYDLTIAGYEGCLVPCPLGSLEEGEPPCVPDYQDQYNSGCNGAGWIEIMAQNGTQCATMCGQSCTFLYNGLSYRDTDWYSAIASGGPVSATCTAEFPLLFIFIYGPDCNNLQYSSAESGACAPAELSGDIAMGAEFWLWVGPSVVTGVPVSGYVFEVCGIIGGSTPTETMSWGAVKAKFLDRPARPASTGGEGEGTAAATGAAPQGSPATPSATPRVKPGSGQAMSPQPLRPQAPAKPGAVRG